MRKKQSQRAQKRAVREPRTLNDLQPDLQNARRHTDRNLAMIGASLDAVGAARSIVIDEQSRVLAGNATLTKGLERGLKLKVVDVDGQTVVAVRRQCFGLELEPQFVQVAIDRWEAFTGKKATKLTAGNPMGTRRPHGPQKRRAG